MNSLLLLAVPLVVGLLAGLIPDRFALVRRWLLPAAAVVHFGLVLRLWTYGESVPVDVRLWLLPDPLGLLFLTLTSGMFLPASLYAVGDMYRHTEKRAATGVSERWYVCGLMGFLLAMSAVCLAQDLGLMWVAVEATTLATAPLIYSRKSPKSLEAMWKYLLVCSVGIALALLGTFIIAAAAGQVGSVTLRVRALADIAPQLDKTLLKAAFIFLLVGYGAKMGLAPMHTWLPDAYSESPSPVWGLLSTTLLNGAFLAILRVADVMQSAGLDMFSNELLRLFGLLSMGIAGAFILGQQDFKRLLAYSSVEHMGILAFGAGLGGAGLWGSLFHAVNHTFVKGSLLLTAGNIMFRYHSKSTLTVHGVRRAMPINGLLWLLGFAAICGLPPFGLFFSEFSIVVKAFSSLRFIEAALYLAFLAVVFIGMLKVFLDMLQGEPPALAPDEKPESVWMALPGMVALAVTLYLGFGLPEQLSDCITQAAHIVDNNFFSMPGIVK